MYEQIIKQSDGTSLGVLVKTWTVIEKKIDVIEIPTLCTKFAHVKKLFYKLLECNGINDSECGFTKQQDLKWWVDTSSIGGFSIKNDKVEITIYQNHHYLDTLKDINDGL